MDTNTDEIITLPPEDVAPWERHEDEGPKAFAAFVAYRDLPPNGRSLKAATVLIHIISTTSRIRQFAKWSSQYNWVARAAEWDLRKDQENRDSQLKAIADMNQRHAGVAEALIQKAIMRIDAMTDDEVKAFTVSELLAIIASSSSLERLARGQPREIVETHNINANLNTTIDEDEAYKLTPVELREKYKRIVAARIARGGAQETQGT